MTNVSKGDMKAFAVRRWMVSMVVNISVARRSRRQNVAR